MRLMSVIFAALCAAHIAQAQAIPGQDDPALAQAIARWLAADDTPGALQEIGQLAADGNVAAQVFANRVYRLAWSYPPGFEARADRMALFAPLDPDTTRRFAPYPGAGDGIAILDLGYDPAMDVGDVTATVTTLAEAGMVRAAVSELSSALNQRGLHTSPLVPIVPYITADDPTALTYWGLTIAAISHRNALPHLAQDWTTQPEEILSESGFFEALADGRWWALLAASFSPPGRGSLGPLLDNDPRIIAIRAFDTEVMGQLIEADTATHGLARLVQLCTATCPANARASCIAGGAMTRIVPGAALSQLEPFVSRDAYVTSPRAEQELVVAFGTAPNVPYACRRP